MNKEQKKKDNKANLKKRFRVGKFFLWLFLILILVVSLTFFVLFKTQTGIQWIENTANAFLDKEERPVRMKIAGLSGNLPFELRIARFEARDQEGIFLDTEKLVLDLSPWDLFSKRIYVQELSAKSFAFYRKPLLPQKEKKRTPSTKEFSLPSLPEILVDKLLLEKIFIGESILGEDTVLNLQGFIANDANLLSSTLALTTLEGLPMELSLKAGFSHGPRILDLQGHFSEKKGQFTKLLKLPALPLSLELKGNGTPGEWLGRLDFLAGNKSSLGTDLKVVWEKQWPSIELKGKLLIDPDLLPGTTDPFLSTSDLEGRFFDDEKKKALVSSLSLKNEKIELGMNAGFLRKTGEIEADLVLAVLEPEELSPTAALYPGSEILLQAKAEGKIKEPEITGRLVLVEPALGKLRFHRLTLKNDLKFKAGKTGKRELHCTGTLEAEEISLDERKAPAPIHTDFDLSYDLADKVFLLNDLNLKSIDLSARAKGGIIQANKVHASLDLELDQVETWRSLFTDLPLSGKGQVSAELQGLFSPLGLKMEVSSTLENLEGFPDPIPGLVGEKLNLRGKTGMLRTDTNDLQFAVLDLKVDSPTFSLSTDGSFSRKKQELSLITHLDIPDLSPLLPKTGMKGSAGLKGEITGKPDDLTFDFALSSKNLSLKENFSIPFLLSLSGTKKNAETKGNLSFKTENPEIPASLESDFFLSGKMLHLPVLNGAFPGLNLHGKGDVNFKGPVITAELAGTLDDAAKLGAVAGLPLKGMGNFTVNLFKSETGQNLALDALFSSLGFNALSLEHFEAKGELSDLFGKKNLDADYLAKNFTAGEILIAESTGKITGKLPELAFTNKTTGEAFGPLFLEINGNYAPESSLQKITISKLDGSWSNFPCHLEKNWILSLKNGGIHSDPLKLRFEEALLLAEGFFEPKKLKLDLKIDNFPVQAIPTGSQGRLGADLQLAGSPLAPVIRLAVEGRNILPQNTTYYKGPGINSSVNAQFKDKNLSFDMSWSEIPEDRPFLKGNGNIPLKLSLQPFLFELTKEAPMAAHLEGRASLERLGVLFMPVTQLIRGDLGINLTLSGKLAKPVLAGDVTLEKGSYQHLEQGVLLQDIHTHLKLSPEKLKLLTLTARDVNGGKLEGTGEILLNPKERFPFEASLVTGEFQVMNSANILAVLQNANIQFTGDLRSQLLKGEVNLERVEYFISDFGGASIAELKVTEIPKPEGEEEIKPQRKRRFAPRLDLAIRIPARLFVRGRGLDSEWGGALNITGITSSPAIRGSIELIRGRMEFLGKRLDLEEGTIVLDGSRPPNPYISVEAHQDGRDVLSILKITGQPSNLKFDLSSEPPLPEDEVLSQMLFGRSISAISPMQAAQLAWAIGELSGYTDGPGVFGMARDFLGLDDLNLVSDGDDPDDIRLRAGKYVHERVYLRVEKDLKTDDDLISADVELTHRLSIESKLGPKGGGVGLYWKRDY
ncbi:translocation/assembly module TamB domain-containing protein [Desulfococcaceae bacterium OttesenSCG-928-F15]|nr:translocation/assembly module TamB domain-containing protein [Desulfococcaceae bacterium OttesenSCG-928-F15]